MKPEDIKLKFNQVPVIVGTIAERIGIIPPKGSTRMVKFPYTTTAQIAMFPYRYYWKNNWFYRYWLISAVLCLPVFNEISKLANSPENKKKWAEIRAKEAAEHH